MDRSILIEPDSKIKHELKELIQVQNHSKTKMKKIKLLKDLIQVGKNLGVKKQKEKPSMNYE